MRDLTRTSLAGGETRLILFGGGPKPFEALRHFARSVSRAGGQPILAIAWASEEPLACIEDLSAELSAFGLGALEASLFPPRSSREKAAVRAQLTGAAGVFFCGGDQNRIMDCLDDPGLKNAFRRRFSDGIPFCGTSAGTAIMSPTSISGEEDGAATETRVGVRPGLGLVSDCIVDQHFLKRRRQDRLFEVVLRSGETLGIGIDEGAALAVRGDRYATVYGGQVMMVAPTGRGTLAVETLEPGECFDLSARRRLPVGTGAIAMPLSFSYLGAHPAAET